MHSLVEKKIWFRFSSNLLLIGPDEKKPKEGQKPEEAGITVEFSKPDEVTQVDIDVAEQSQGITIEMDIAETSELSATEVSLTKQDEIFSSEKSAIEITLDSTQTLGMNHILI